MKKPLLPSKRRHTSANTATQDPAKRSTNIRIVFLALFSLLILIGGAFLFANLSYSPQTPSPSNNSDHSSNNIDDPSATRSYSKMNLKDGLLDTDQLKTLIGMRFAEDEPEMRTLNLDASKVLLRSQLPEKCRVIPPGSMVTMDFVEDRLNVYINDQKVVTKAKYG